MPEYTIQELEAFRLKQLIAQQLLENAKYVTAPDARELHSLPLRHLNRINRNKGKWRRK